MTEDSYDRIIKCVNNIVDIIDDIKEKYEKNISQTELEDILVNKFEEFNVFDGLGCDEVRTAIIIAGIMCFAVLKDDNDD